jgi:hypothetical protein
LARPADPHGRHADCCEGGERSGSPA